MSNFYSVSCIIEEEVSIGEGSKVWYFTHIVKHAKLGRDCNIGEKTYIGEGVLIGDDVRVGNNTNIYKGAVIKDRVFIGNNVSFTNVRKPIASQPSEKLLDTIIENDVSIGAHVTIVGGIKIGEGAVIADGAVVVGNVPAGAWVNGNPGRIKLRNNKYE